MLLQNIKVLYDNEDENPISVLLQRMRVPLLIGIGSGLVIQASKGVFETAATFGRIAYTTLPICGLGFFYLSGTHISKRIRDKDDVINHVMGVFSTIPLVRKFLPLSYTIPVIFGVTFPLVILVQGYAPIKPLSIEERMNYGIQVSGFDLNLWLQKKPSEPYVKRQSSGLFTIPSN